MGDFQKFEQDFYQSGYYIDDQGQVVYDYNGYDLNPEYEDDGIDVSMPGMFAPSMGHQYTGQVYQPTTPTGTYQYTAGTDRSYEEEPLLLDEIGMNFEHILQKTLTVLNSMIPADGSIMNETDLTVTLLMAVKSHFGYVYGISTIGCMAIYTLLTLMSSLTVSYGCVASVLGYRLLPMVARSAFAVVFPLQRVEGSSERSGPSYPCALHYGVFAWLTVF
uniref:Zgc:123321 n=1 Tax=Hucho hucho TaxID=62062 RepID=A0A4W5PH63_9TELE